MKRFYLVIILLCINFIVSAQKRQEAITTLKEDLMITNSQLPFKAGFITLQKMEIIGNEYIAYLKVDENQQDLDRLVDNMNKYRSNIFTMVAGQRKEYASLLITSGLNLKYIVSGNISKRTKQFIFSSKELKDICGKKYSSKDYLVDLVSEMNKATPEDWGEGLICTSIQIEGKYVCFRVNIDNSALTISTLKYSYSDSDIDELKDALIEEYNNTDDPADIFFMRHLRNCGMGIRQIFWSKKTNETFSYEISPQIIKTKIRERSLYEDLK